MVKEFIYSLMTDKREGGAYIPLKFMLLVLSFFYGMGIAARALFYRFGIFKKEKPPICIISVGNLTLGGTGKTPFVMMLAGILKDELARQVSILIRGYGWDEQAMLKEKVSDIPVIVGEDRVKSARRAIRVDTSDTAILDDGFQYWELARDLDIVLVDSRNPFGNGHLFPRGILRETKTALERADIVVFTKVNKSKFDINVLKEEMKTINDRILFLETVHRPRYLYDFKTKTRDSLSSVNGRRIILVSSIGDPDYFEETMKDMGSTIIEHIKFSDHHNYRQKEMEYIASRCGESNAGLLVTTEKDAVKLRRLRLSTGECSLKVLAVEMEITDGREELIVRLHSLYSDKGLK